MTVRPAHAQGVPLGDATLQGDELIQTPVGEIALVDTYFDNDASRRLFDDMDYQRAVQSYIWSMPLVSMTTWRENQGAAYGVKNRTDFVVLESLREKRGIVTGNLTTPYIFNFYNLSDGALQIDYPAGKTAGGVLDFWQRPVFDLGLTGPDKGQGATYIVVGPNDDPQKYKKEGAHVYRSATNNIFIGLRVLDKDSGYFDKFASDTRWARLAASWRPASSSRARTSLGARPRRGASTIGGNSPRSSRKNPFARWTRPGWPCSHRSTSQRESRSGLMNASSRF